MSSAYSAGSRAIQLTQDGDATHAEELWFTNRVRFMFLNAVRVGDFVYGTTGDFGPAFLTALNIKTGQSAWQHRGFGRASMVYADGKAIIMDEDGDLALARLAPEGVTDAVGSEEGLRHGVVDGADAGRHDALRARSREDRRAQPGSPVMRDRRSRSPSRSSCAGRSRSAQAPDLSGTWKLDEAKSKVVATAGIIGLIPAGAPKTLHITQPANGTVVIESQINEAHVRIYKPGRETSTPAGQGGAVTMTSKWEGRSLVSEGAMKAPNGDTTTVREVVSLSADGKMLTMEVTTTDGSRESVEHAGLHEDHGRRPVRDVADAV